MDEPEAAPNAAANSDEMSHAELVVVFDTQEESEAWVVKSLLESAGIEALITGLDAPQDVLPGVGGVVVRVNPTVAAQARQVIQDYHASADAIENEDDVSGEPG